MAGGGGGGDLAGLPPEAARLLASANLSSTRDVLLLSATDLRELLDVPASTADALLAQVAMLAAPPFCTVRARQRRGMGAAGEGGGSGSSRN